MTYRSTAAVWARAATFMGMTALSGVGHAQSLDDIRAKPWLNPPVPTVQTPRLASTAQPLKAPTPKAATKIAAGVAAEAVATSQAKAAPKPLARCVQLSASQSGIGEAETLAQARGNLQDLALATARQRGWPERLAKTAEKPNCAAQFFLPLFGTGFDCRVSANFCVR